MAVLDTVVAAAESVLYRTRRWLLTRRLALLKYRRRELHEIVERELAAIDYEEHVTNAALREMQSSRMNARADEYIARIRP